MIFPLTVHFVSITCPLNPGMLSPVLSLGALLSRPDTMQPCTCSVSSLAAMAPSFVWNPRMTPPLFPMANSSCLPLLPSSMPLALIPMRLHTALQNSQDLAPPLLHVKMPNTLSMTTMLPPVELTWSPLYLTRMVVLAPMRLSSLHLSHLTPLCLLPPHTVCCLLIFSLVSSSFGIVTTA